MERRANSNVILLLDEKFDFDVPMSPDCSTCDEEQDDVFLDPSHHRVKRPPANLASHPEEGVGGVRTSWSPLLGDQLDAMCQEAKRLADQLQCGKWPHGKDEGAAPATAAPASASLAQQDVEHFIQDGAAKLGVLASPPSLSSPVKRQTFLVQDSPMKDLPPAIRNHMQRGSAAAHLGASAAPATRLSTRLATSSPAAGGKTRAALRGKTGLGAILPSKPAAPRTSSSASKGIAAQKVQVPKHGKVASGCKPNQSSDLASRTKSCEDILSDSASVVSDVSDSSLNSSIAGKKRTLAPPTKVVVRQSGVKATPLQSGKTTERRNTSSSSSSVSSFNSSLSLSPATGKLNSVNRGVSPSNGPVVSGNGSRPVNPNKRRSGVGGVTRTVASSPSPSSSSVAASRRRSGTLTGQARKLSEPAKAARTTPQHQTTPAKRTLDKTSLTTASAWIQSGLKTKSKFAAVGQTPIPSEGAAGQGFCSPDVSMVLKPKRLLSVASMDSLPQKPCGPLTPSAGVSRPLHLCSQRPSGLPTPLKRRASAIPTPTSGSLARISGPSRTQAASDSDFPTRTCLSPTPTDSSRVEPVDIQPFCLEDEEHPVEPSQSEIPESEELSSHGRSEPSKVPFQPESARQDVLLLDLPAPTPPTHEKLLIDLSNTPDLIRNSTKNCATMQHLIDLSSPLIKWSPEDKKENSAPLINLSF
ncbi:G2 and S phase-expressed protein 1 isoform X2 [Phyllopteryx taeniolatus]|uniref:G2 and S phase-expressed protein 1 isoform X2 n=1 Tax=Phyllopteryx taeniolatus TaxID=161469 RepID=UPI002AD5B146|nr:G2 and S phase-expressed protein 1 isoform X2 [Phyllopteryx taeniolatus]XP_061629085.1 G2 and S phase-expressed protein 1 isoform X2 [Phyllopteryx taeniolatus]